MNFKTGTGTAGKEKACSAWDPEKILLFIRIKTDFVMAEEGNKVPLRLTFRNNVSDSFTCNCDHYFSFPSITFARASRIDCMSGIPQASF